MILPLIYIFLHEKGDVLITKMKDEFSEEMESHLERRSIMVIWHLFLFMWIAKAYQVEQCYILRLSAKRGRHGCNTEGKNAY